MFLKAEEAVTGLEGRGRCWPDRPVGCRGEGAGGVCVLPQHQPQWVVIAARTETTAEYSCTGTAWGCPDSAQELSKGGACAMSNTGCLMYTVWCRCSSLDCVWVLSHMGVKNEMTRKEPASGFVFSVTEWLGGMQHPRRDQVLCWVSEVTSGTYSSFEKRSIR